MTRPRNSKRGESTTLEQLLDRIRAGTLTDIDELEPHDLDLLIRHCGNQDEVEALLDSMRDQRENG